MPTATLEMNDPKTRNLVAVKRKLLIDGKWVDAQSGETFPVYNPATGEVMDQCAAGDKADIDLAVKAARRAFERRSMAAPDARPAWQTDLEARRFDRRTPGRVCPDRVP